MTDDTKAYVAITRLQAAYADVVTRRAWGELGGLFVVNASIHIDTVTRPVIDLTGPSELGAFIGQAMERFDFLEFVILNTVLDIRDDGTASGRLYMVEVRQERESGQWSNAFGLYRDSYVERDGGWRFAARNYRSLARRHPGGSEILSTVEDIGRQ